ncbi:MAG: MFS transporter [Mycobacterium sp.]|uniref:MFS transporter n=1 Tax=Mycobacterium sp. TaxID=1785 RepID=UPI001EB2A230|nr:MFS transporter [Mycobacterium sp.]MBW0018646.1 MFS transporter [Mycobacterium sp.]
MSFHAATSRGPGASHSGNPWSALWAMLIGFFMIMLDATIVAIANPTIMAELGVGYATVIWVTSAYLLGYAVVLLVAGRLGDRYGPKNLYLIGLVVFTLASVWCGLSGSAAMLIAARVVQGVGAGVLTPQTLSTITRIFPAQRRGAAMSMWGATAGVASLVGPLAGGVLVDGLGWEWIFFVNVPIGVAGLALAVWLVPALPTQSHRFDLVGVGLSGLGMFAIVFGLQQGQSAGWAPWIWAVIVAGLGLMAAFGYWQLINASEPLIPLRIFADRDFSLCNVGVALTAFATTAMMLPLTFYTQGVCGLSPTLSALLIAPMAVTSGALAPVVGMIVDRYPPQPVLGFGFSMLAIGATWLSIEMAPDTPIWRLVLPMCALGVGMAFVWSPLAATATRHLPSELAGASSGVYNATRQLGAVLGSAGMAAFMASRISAEMPRGDGHVPAGSLQLPTFVREPFAAALSQSMLLPAFVVLFGIIAALLLAGFATSAFARDNARRAGGASGAFGGSGAFGASGARGASGACDASDDEWFDDDDYVEYVLVREPIPAPPVPRRPAPPGRPVPSGRPVPPRRPVPSGRPVPPVRRGQPPRGQPVRPPSGVRVRPQPRADPIGFAHNGSHIDPGERLRRVGDPAQTSDPDDPATSGRHSSGA